MKKKILLAGLGTIALIGAAALTCDFVVSLKAEGRLYDDIRSVPHRKIGLVLGTSPVSTLTGKRNRHFDNRIRAAADLLLAGKVDMLVVSGGDYRDSEEKGYDEPAAMRDSLIKLGVDPQRIVLDYDGTRTLNSIAKVKNAYRQDSVTIISQEYHNQRALCQADYLGVDAIAYNAPTPDDTGVRLRNRAREVLARVRLFIDIARNARPETGNN